MIRKCLRITETEDDKIIFIELLNEAKAKLNIEQRQLC